MFKIYFTTPDGSTSGFHEGDLLSALSATEFLRKEGMRFVTMVSEDPNSVGKPGVDEVINGVCPNGVLYDWKKRR